jgi:hypothetical protein
MSFPLGVKFWHYKMKSVDKRNIIHKIIFLIIILNFSEIVMTFSKIFPKELFLFTCCNSILYHYE